MPRNSLRNIIAGLSLAIGITTASAPASAYNGLYVFGDSLSDNGNLYTFTGGTNPLSPPYWSGRFSNGEVAVERMATLMGTPLIDYAIGGAKTGMNDGTDFISGPGYTGRGLTAQVARAVGPDPHDGSLNSSGLYVLWAGPNDFFSMPAGTNPYTTAGTAIGNMASAVQALYADGARHFFVPLMPDLGLTPFARANGPSFMGSASFLTDTYNTNLQSTLSFIDQNLMPNGDIRFFDTATFLRNVVNHPPAGFANVTDNCLTQTATLTTICSNPDSYLFWDGVHPTAAAHRALGDAFAAAVPEPETYAMMLMGLGLLGFVARRRKQHAA